MTHLLAGAALLLVVSAGAAQGGQRPAATTPPTAPGTPDSYELPVAYNGPPVPVPPAVMARDAAGRATIRAVRIPAPLKVDGRLDEGVYADVPSMSDFLQTEPLEGAPATQRTEVWLFFDDNNVYVSGRCWEAHMDRIVANEMRRDANQVFSSNDAFGFLFDTFYDRRNGIALTVNAIGGRTDGQATNERQFNLDFNPVWDVQVGRFDGGWTVEAAVPFKSLRYRPGTAQVWGFNVRRHTPWKNETSFLVPTSAAQGPFGIVQSSIAATVVGLEVPPRSRNLEIKPFVTSSLTTDAVAQPAVSNDPAGDVGVDAKYGVTQGLTADLTYNTDFAQVEADEQQINLTRFNLFFPEKREFFLENKGTFDFGGAGTGGGGTSAASDTPTLFYSRRVGLYQGRSVPIQGGGRLSGRAGRYSLGLLNIETGDDPATGARQTNFSVARIKRDILRRSFIGAMVTRRSVREQGAGSNEAYGVDGAFAFFSNLTVNTYWARTHTARVEGQDTSYRAQLDYAADRYGVQLEHLSVGDNFSPEVGFLRRDDMRKSYGYLRFSPRSKRIRSVRKFSGITTINYIENGAGRRDTRTWDGEFAIELQNSDRFSVSDTDSYEYLSQPFRIAPAVTLPVGGYGFNVAKSAYTFGPQRRVSGVVSVEHGTFYSGHRTTVAVGSGRLELTHQFSLQPTLSVNSVDLPEGSFTTTLVGSRVTYTMTPQMFVSALLQYSSSSHSVTANVRLRWEYRPGSELFVVYNEQRDTLARAFPDLQNRALIVKINRLFRF